MAEYINLLGAEEVSRAATRMVSAASEMSQAVNNLSSILDQNQRFMDDWLERLKEFFPQVKVPPEIVYSTSFDKIYIASTDAPALNLNETEDSIT